MGTPKPLPGILQITSSHDVIVLTPGTVIIDYMLDIRAVVDDGFYLRDTPVIGVYHTQINLN